jgi:hypothetical protein
LLLVLILGLLRILTVESEGLEELPLEHLCALVGVGRHVLRRVPEEPEDRVRLRERTSVVEDERGHAQSRVQGAEQLLPVRAIDDRDVDGLVLEPEVGEEEPHLVAVARDGRVVEKHTRSLRDRPSGLSSVFTRQAAVTRRPARRAECRGP